jgi:ribonuclease J
MANDPQRNEAGTAAQAESPASNRRRRRRPGSPATAAPAQAGTEAPASKNRATDGDSSRRLRVIPLGGVGEVGKNMTAVEYGDDLVLLDCGGKFPDEGQRGIDLVVPDINYVKQRRRNLRAILITHGHDDHIGALPYVIPQLRAGAPIPIYGSPLSLGFIEERLREHRLVKQVDLRPVKPGETVQLGRLTAEFIHVTHSIPDTNAIAIHTPVGTIVDTADFKFDPTPVLDRPADEQRLRRLGQSGVLALFSDTVRIETAGSTPSERIVLETIDRVVQAAKGQAVVATFASNISRIHIALLVAQKYGRKVAVAGRSMEQNARVAVDLGYLDPPPGLLLPLDEVLRLPAAQRLLVITGSQGETAAALSRIAAGEHRKIHVGKGDVIVVSASPIPGNEETVSRAIDNLFRRGAHVVYTALEPGVHVSGHAGRAELKRMLELLHPRYAVPIHGEYRHMMLYRDLCAEVGIPAERVLLPEIGGVLEFSHKKGTHAGRVPAGSILVDRLGERGDGHVTLRDRAHLADDGVVVVTVVIDRYTGTLIAGPDLVPKGLKPELTDKELRLAAQDLRKALDRRPKGEPQVGYLAQQLKQTVGKSLYRFSKSRPMILPVVTEL